MTNGWHSAAVICNIVDGELCFLVQDSMSKDPRWKSHGTKTKCVGGGMMPVVDRDPVDTLRREIKEEIFLKLPREINPTLIHSIPKENHIQYFYLVWFNDMHGKIRGRNKILVDGDTALFNLRWLKLSEIAVVFEPHREVLRMVAAKVNDIPLALVG